MSISEAEIRAKIATVPVWYHKITLPGGIVTPGINDPLMTLCHLEMPEDCKGKRVLDLGTRDGFFAFELERRGAEVVAVDYVAADVMGFKTVADILGSKVTFLRENIYNLTPEKIGTFDIVLFLGLLYHLPDPVQAINIVRNLCTGRMCLETHAIDNAVLLPDGSTRPLSELSPILTDIPLMQFYPGKSLAGDPTNYWGPNLKCLEGMLAECRFQVVSRTLTENRAILNCDAIVDRKTEYFLKMARGLRPNA